jgi:hypothetical protein
MPGALGRGARSRKLDIIGGESVLRRRLGYLMIQCVSKVVKIDSAEI